MSHLTNIPFEEESTEIKKRVTDYWTTRAEGFYEMRHDEIESNKAELWLQEIHRAVGERKHMNVLDVGCGAGFFEVLLGREGHRVTGIDLTEAMVTKANQMIASYGCDPAQVQAMVMDAEQPEFQENTFDLVITRNLTWTLPHPVEAYAQWLRVLKPGGILLNFDAEYAKNAHRFNPEDNIAHKGLSQAQNDACHAIYHMLTISTLDRPHWDRLVLQELGFSAVDCDVDFGDRVYAEKDEFYMPDRMFLIRAVK